MCPPPVNPRTPPQALIRAKVVAQRLMRGYDRSYTDSPGHILSSYGTVSPPRSSSVTETPRRRRMPEVAPETWRIAASVALYGALSIGMTLLFKKALSVFSFPCALVAGTFVLEALAVEAGARCEVVDAEARDAEAGDGNRRALLCIACCVGGEVALSNAGLMLLSVAAHTMIKACTPVFVLLAALLLKLEPPSCAAFGIVVLISGGTILCSAGPSATDETAGQIHRQILGAVLTVGAGAVGGLRWGLTQLATQRAAIRVRPKALVRRTLPTSAAFLVCVALLLDAPRAYAAFDPSQTAAWVRVLALAVALAGGGLALLRVEVALVAMTSSLSLSIAAVTKELLLIFVSVTALHDAITPKNVAGFGLTACGVVAYNVHKCASRVDAAAAAGARDATLLATARRAYERVPNADADATALVPLARAGDEERARAYSCPTAPDEETVDF